MNNIDKIKKLDISSLFRIACKDLLHCMLMRINYIAKVGQYKNSTDLPKLVYFRMPVWRVKIWPKIAYYTTPSIYCQK